MSLSELAVIFLVVLLVFGPEKLPEIARFLGKLSADLRRASDGIRREFYDAGFTPQKNPLREAGDEVAKIGMELQADLNSIDELKSTEKSPTTLPERESKHE